MKKNKGLMLLVGGALLFGLGLGSEAYLSKKQHQQYQKSFSILLQEKKSIENHMHHMENREQVLLTRIKKAEEKLHSFKISD